MHPKIMFGLILQHGIHKVLDVIVKKWHYEFMNRLDSYQHHVNTTDNKFGGFGMAIVNRTSGMAYLPL